MDTTPSESSAAPSTPATPPPPPPLIQPSSPAKPPHKGRGWMIFAIVLIVLLGFSVLMNVGQLFDSLLRLQSPHTRSAGPQLHEVVLEYNRADSKIAVVPVEGLISSLQDRAGFSIVEVIKAQLKRAAADEDVAAVLLKVDSPGGEVLASDEISRALTAFQKKSGKPVIVSMGSLAASGGYYVSAPCRWIVANEMTITGSIGVIMSSWNYRGLMSKVGIRPFTYKSGKFKDMLSGSRDPDEIPVEERAMLQALIDQTYDRFKTVVTDGRNYAHEKNEDEGKALAPNWADYADGRVLSGKEAHQLGFVDELGNFETAVDRAKELAGIKRANLVEYRLRVDLADILGLFGQSESRVVKVDLGLDTPKLEAGRLYFLSPTYLH